MFDSGIIYINVNVCNSFYVYQNDMEYTIDSGPNVKYFLYSGKLPVWVVNKVTKILAPKVCRIALSMQSIN